jgi:diacylglycerol kinase (ATP)
VSVGGDGTNNEVINGFFENGRMINPVAVFAIICSGTGSDFIKTAGVPRDYRESIPLLKGKKFKNIDLGWMTHKDHSGEIVERYFINIASFGMGGLSDSYVNKSKKLLGGKATFLLAATRAGLFYKNQPVRFRLDDGKEIERKIFNMAVSNGRYFGAGMMVAPMADLEDGTFEVVILGDLGIPARLKLSTAIRSGAHIKMPGIEHFRARHIVVDSPEIVLLDVDGEQPGSLPAEFKVLPKAIRFKVPG